MAFSMSQLLPMVQADYLCRSWPDPQNAHYLQVFIEWVNHSLVTRPNYDEASSTEEARRRWKEW